MEQPKFVRDFSKKESPEERDSLAKEIREKRSDYFENIKVSESKDQEKNEIIEEIENLKKKIEEYNDASFFSKVKDFLAIKKNKSDMQSKLGQQQTIEEELAQSIEGRPGLDETRRMLSDFYAHEKNKWEESEFSKEDIEKYFSEENLTSLSIEDYVLLLKRFPGQMVTHVTRQGVRDHITMYEHRAGMGEVHNGFKDMLDSKRLRSPLAVAMTQTRTDHDICQFLNGGTELTTVRDVSKRKGV